MVNLRSPVVKISWPIHLPGRNLSQHSSWLTCCLSWTNRIFSPFWGSLSKWTLWWQPSSLSISPPTLFWGQCVRQHYLLPGFFQPCWTFAYWKSSMRTLDSAQLLTDIEVAPDSRGCGSRHLISSPTNEYQDVVVVWQITLRIPHVASCSKWM